MSFSFVLSGSTSALLSSKINVSSRFTQKRLCSFASSHSAHFANHKNDSIKTPVKALLRASSALAIQRPSSDVSKNIKVLSEQRLLLRVLRKFVILLVVMILSPLLTRSVLAACIRTPALLTVKPPSYRRREVLLIGASFISGLIAGVSLIRGSEFFRRYETVADIPRALFKRGAIIRAVVVKVSDGDTYRVRHVPMWLNDAEEIMEKVKGRGGRKLSESTIVVRIAGVDTPEIAKFGHKGQRYGEEAKRFVQDRLLHKTVFVKLLSRDQYGRAVCAVYRGLLPVWPFAEDIGGELLAAGLGFVYTAAGAQYDGRELGYRYRQEEAKKKKAGVWGLSKREFQTPGEYKAKLGKS